MANTTVNVSVRGNYEPTYTHKTVVKVPGAVSITKITAIPSVSANNLSYTFNSVTEEITITAILPYTSHREATFKQDPLTNTYISGGRLYCTWGSGGTSSSPYTGQSCSPYAMVVDQHASYDFLYNINIEYDGNRAPSISLDTTDNRTLYENDTFNLAGTYNDVDSGNVISVKYSINNGTARALTSSISDGVAKTFNRVLSYKNKKLYDGTITVTDTLAEGTQHVVKVWAEDDKGGKSQEQLRIFYVIANRAPVLTVNPFVSTSGLLNTGNVKVTGSVTDPDGNTVKVEYKLRNESFTEIYSGTGGTFEIVIPLSALAVGVNALSIKAVDSYGATTTRTLNMTKAGASVPLNESHMRYRITPPNGSAQGVLLWVQRELGDLDVVAEISMTAAGEPENFVPMPWASTANVNGTIQEDEFVYDIDTSKENIIVQLKMSSTNPASTAGIRLVNGVLN